MTASLAATPHFAMLAQRAGVAAHQPRLYLFSNVSGHMARAGVDRMASELGAKVYRVDLSMIVSKFVAETERNLDRAFLAAQSAGSILFLDEADALFGKRTSVKDAHDRYADQEIDYLLQRLERYNGVAVLATRSPPPQLSLSRMRVITVRWPP
ncbi:ATP-binding protein [Bosea sp. 685]|uniref:ATP-binding protein n=1 Tax=Bosea sp. 685 TaxID=3080057 RepID=UPI00289301EE|nr:ATP-binding protein [Bosea sp. 685]WNJ91163.1 ATP-binding protein [Bosea sp. 685]